MICPVCFEQMKRYRGRRQESINVCENHDWPVIVYADDPWHYYQGDAVAAIEGPSFMHVQIVNLAAEHNMTNYNSICIFNTGNSPEKCMKCPLVSEYDGQKMCFDQFIKGLKK